MGRLTTFDELSQRLLDLILSATESEHIALMLDPHGPIHAKEFSLSSVQQLPARQGPFTVSRTRVQRVLENGEGIVCKEVAGEAWLKRGKQRYGEPVFARRCVCHGETNEVFVADGYINRRVIVFDADTGAFKRMWGRLATSRWIRPTN